MTCEFDLLLLFYEVHVCLYAGMRMCVRAVECTTEHGRQQNDKFTNGTDIGRSYTVNHAQPFHCDQNDQMVADLNCIKLNKWNLIVDFKW